ncbi:MAG: kynureninase, partial [Actinomycetota bacterium]
MDRSDALTLDAQDPLHHYKTKFVVTDPDMCYLDGNSLGRLPHATVKAINDFLTHEWGPEVVTGWGHWVDEAQSAGDLIGRSALGAAPGQVLACDTTSVNFYQLASAAIRARPNRKTIIIDAANFPTDRYIMQGLAKHHGLNLVTINNEDPSISTNELITPELLKKYLNDDVALVSLEVVQYRSGARQDIKAINDLVKSYGAMMLWDAAHAVGSVAMNFDANGVDLAVGCTYKYGNSGPGAPAWLYVSKSMQKELQVPIQGWFAQRDQFAMGPTFEKEGSIRGFQIASPSLMGLRCIKSAFSMIEEAGIEKIEIKASRGTEMMIELFDLWLSPLGFTLNTPRDPKQRCGHISLVHPEAEKIAIALRQYANVIPDYRV